MGRWNRIKVYDIVQFDLLWFGFLAFLFPLHDLISTSLLALSNKILLFSLKEKKSLAKLFKQQELRFTYYNPYIKQKRKKDNKSRGSNSEKGRS